MKYYHTPRRKFKKAIFKITGKISISELAKEFTLDTIL